MATSAIWTHDLVRLFGHTRTLESLDREVAHGEVQGFLGPNGAGKPSTIRVLLGLLRAESGSVSLFGQDPWKDAIPLRSRLTYVPGNVELWPNVTGGEIIDLFARPRGERDQKRVPIAPCTVGRISQDYLFWLLSIPRVLGDPHFLDRCFTVERG